MKKMRYAIGAAGLAPTAALLMPTGAAQAQQAPTHTRSKTVKSDIRHTPDIACGASKWNRNPATGALYLGFWSDAIAINGSENTCVGTVKATFPFSIAHGNVIYAWRVRIYVSGNLEDTFYPGQIHNTTMYAGIQRDYYPDAGELPTADPRVCSAISSSNTPGVWRGRYCINGR